MKNATIKFLLPNAFPISKTGFYNKIQAPKVKISPRGFSWGFEAVARTSKAQKSACSFLPLTMSCLHYKM
jgi:hypothetical protein